LLAGAEPGEVIGEQYRTGFGIAGRARHIAGLQGGRGHGRTSVLLIALPRFVFVSLRGLGGVYIDG
jgi:hypothetical protein